VHRVRSPLVFEPEPTKGSRFRALVVPVADEAEARAAHAELAAAMPDASHHCWAWRFAVPAIERAGDDGEPGGSAGRPILAQLAGRDIVHTAVIVSRWFGGTKLGVGGLVRAYGGAAAQALDRAELVPWVAEVAVTVTHDHVDSNPVEHVIRALAVTEVDVGWGTRVTRYLTVPEPVIEEFWARLSDATSGRVSKP
jgi:putative IMPACT (imprinted ancient) family translation regulator